MRFIRDIQENERVIEHYLCKQKQMFVTGAGKNYLSLKLQDKTGQADAKVWELNNNIQDFEENDFIKIDGVALLYRDELQIKISRIRRSNEGEYNFSDYIPCTKKDVNALYSRLLEYAESITHPKLKLLVGNILLRNERISGAIKTHSAAKNMHHAFMGGLLEHTVSVAEICDFMSGRYDYINRDVLIAAALLHDIAKIFELEPMPANAYTDDGKLLGHIYMGAELVTLESIKIPGFPQEVLNLLKHAILAHHGEYEFGSPKLPSTIEAFILHAADNFDAKVKAYEEAIENDNSPGAWMLTFNKTFSRYLRKSEIETV